MGVLNIDPQDRRNPMPLAKIGLTLLEASVSTEDSELMDRATAISEVYSDDEIYAAMIAASGMMLGYICATEGIDPREAVRRIRELAPDTVDGL